MNATSHRDPTWESRLREAGLRVTRPRVMILELMQEIGGHRSAEDINAILESAGTPLTRGTVYNVLDDLASAGLAMRADHGPGTALYEIAEEWHHHFVCRECGAIIDVPCVIGEKPCLDAELPGAEIDEAQVIFRGICPDCVATR